MRTVEVCSGAQVLAAELGAGPDTGPWVYGRVLSSMRLFAHGEGWRKHLLQDPVEITVVLTGS